MTKAFILLLAVCTLAIGAPAFADTYSWTYSGGSDSGSGTLTTTALSGGQATILGVSGTFNGDSITGLLSTDTCCSAPANDNILYYPATPYLDVQGIGFGFMAGAEDVNIYFCGAGCTLGSGYSVLSAPAAGAPNGFTLTSQDGAFNITPTPEPATLALLGSGFFGLFVARRKRV
jgi:hypothetical protein